MRRQMTSERKGIALREIQAKLATQGVEVRALSTIADMLHRLGLSHNRIIVVRGMDCAGAV
jgi:sulfur carrier protein ThiS